MFNKAITVKTVETLSLTPIKTAKPKIVIEIAVGRREVKASTIPLRDAEDLSSSNSYFLTSSKDLETNYSHA
jgi:hypothetical protein